jgi:hypothetical protein
MEPNPENLKAWIRLQKEREARPVTVDGPAGTVTFTYRDVLYLRDDLAAAARLIARLADGEREDPEWLEETLERLLGSELLVRLLLEEEDCAAAFD